ncbi:MAG: glycosyltransferase family 39 protein [Candidatus Omnitrophota bacterium]
MSVYSQDKFELGERTAHVLLFCIILLGLFLRLPFRGKIISGNESLLYSECVKLSQGITPQEFSASWSPFFLSSWHGWLLSDLRALVYSVFPFLNAQFYLTLIFGILIIVSTYRLGTRLYNKITALFAALLVAIAPIQVSLSYGLSSEIPLVFFILETIIWLIDAIEKKSRSSLFISSVFFSCAMLSKPLAVLFMPAICFYFIINKRKLKGGCTENIIIYLFFPLALWLTWVIPNFKRFYSDMPFAFSSFVLKSGSESMRHSLEEIHLQLLSPVGIILLLFSLINLIFSRNVNSYFLLFIILSFVFILNLSKNIMLYYYALICPFYFIAIAQTILSLKQKILQAVLVLASLYFIFLSIKTDIINIDFDTFGQGGCELIYNFKNKNLMVVGQGVFDTIMELNKIIKDEDTLYLTSHFLICDGFLKKGRKFEYTPAYDYICGDKICPNQNFVKELEESISRPPHTGKIYAVCQDGGYYYRVGGKGVWRQSNYAGQLSACGFRKVYENNSPDKEWLKKCRKYFKRCDTNQWVRNYIFVK